MVIGFFIGSFKSFLRKVLFEDFFGDLLCSTGWRIL